MLQVVGYHIQVSRKHSYLQIQRVGYPSYHTYCSSDCTENADVQRLQWTWTFKTKLEKQCKKEQHREGVTIFT